MSIFDGWQTLADADPVGPNDQIRIHLDFSCAALNYPSQTDVSNAIASMVNISDGTSVVSSVSGASLGQITNLISLGFEQEYVITVNPAQNEQAGDIREAAQTALTQLQQAQMIPCSTMAVGVIEKFVPGTGLVGALSGASAAAANSGVPQAINTASYAVIALVVLALVFYFGLGRARA